MNFQTLLKHLSKFFVPVAKLEKPLKYTWASQETNHKWKTKVHSYYLSFKNILFNTL